MPVNDLPVQLTSFIGREQEVARLTKLLADARLVTLTGPGGAGKTRTAVEAARGWEVGEAVFVELAPIVDQTLIPSAIAVALGVAEVAGEPLLDAVVRSLRSRRVLLVLDNCEHVVVGCAVAAEQLLRACPALTVLATSREPLNAGGEVLQRLAPLEPAEAAALFVERASAAEPGFAARQTERADLESICRQLDGLPLAIELAAPYVRMLSLKELAARLDQRFGLLQARSPTAIARHQTLRALVDWSYELLTADEQRLYRGMSVFAGGCTLDAIAGVCCDDIGAGEQGPALSPAQRAAEGDGLPAGAMPVTTEGWGKGDSQGSPQAQAPPLQLLRALVEKSFVIADETEDGTRYRMLETLRQHGRDKLREAGEERALRRHHLDWFRDLAERGLLVRRGGDEVLWQRRMEREVENCRVALLWSRIEPAQQQAGLRLAAALANFWRLAGHAREAFEWLTTLLPGAPPNATRAKALQSAGWIALHRREPDPQPFLEEALSLARSLAEPSLVVVALRSLGFLWLQRGDAASAQAALDEGLALAQTPDLLRWRPELQRLLGQVLAAMRQPDAALTCLREALRLARERQDLFYTALALRELGALLLDLGQLAEARECLEESLSSETRISAATGTLVDFGGLVLAEGDAAGAVRLAAAASALREAWPDRLGHGPINRSERYLNAASEALGPAARQAARAEGAAMSLAQAVDYALRRGTSEASAPERLGGLTPRELEVAQLLAGGQTNRQIADTLVIAERTAHRHVENILGKLGLNNRAQIAAWAVEHGLSETPRR